MRFRYFLLCCLSVSIQAAFSQSVNQAITIKSERDAQSNVVLTATNSDVIPYTVLITYSNLQNLAPSSTVPVVTNPGQTRVGTLKPLNSGQGTNYSFTYRFVKGNIYGKPKVNPVYFIPVAEGTKVIALKMDHIANRIREEQIDDFVGVSFRFEKPTVIVAPRKGIISAVEMYHQNGKDNLNYSANENMIEIYHEDGSFTRLSVLKAGTEKVEVGQIVFPGDVLAESAGENYLGGPHVRVVNFRYQKDGPDKFKSEVFPVTFITEPGQQAQFAGEELLVVHPEAIKIMELSKRELKALQSEK
jgi:murein DD-endopeptidase MepM/ murein hydrolase activator NlpD